MNRRQDGSFTSVHDKEDFKKSADVSTRLNLTQVYLAHAELKMFNPVRKVANTEMVLQMAMETGFSFDEKSNYLSSIIKLNLKGILDADGIDLPKGTEVIEIQCTFALEAEMLKLYESEEDRNEHLKCFSTIGATLVMWPFLREFVYSQSSRTGLNSLILPYIKLVHKEPTQAD